MIRIQHALLAGLVALAAALWISSAIAREPTAPDNAVLPVEMLEIKTANGSFRFTVEIADDPAERSRGLMHRQTMPPTHGMLFVFDKIEPVMMWMADTPLSLDMIFIRPDGVVSRIADRTVPHSRDIIASGEPVAHVLELNAGISAQIGLKQGDRVVHRVFDAN